MDMAQALQAVAGPDGAPGLDPPSQELHTSLTQAVSGLDMRVGDSDMEIPDVLDGDSDLEIPEDITPQKLLLAKALELKV